MLTSQVAISGVSCPNISEMRYLTLYINLSATVVCSQWWQYNARLTCNDNNLALIQKEQCSLYHLHKQLECQDDQHQTHVQISSLLYVGNTLTRVRAIVAYKLHWASCDLAHWDGLSSHEVNPCHQPAVDNVSVIINCSSYKNWTLKYGTSYNRVSIRHPRKNFLSPTPVRCL